MDLTSQAINEAEFSMARRGYDPDQVDEFLEKLAVAVDKQNEALAEARERAAMAERRAAEAERVASERPERVVEVPAARGDDAGRSAEVAAAAEAELETLKRTLVLAQRTADAAIRDAEQQAARLIEAAEADARAAQESTRARLLEEIGNLDADRESLRADVGALESHLDQQRTRLRAAIADLQRVLDEPNRLKPVPAPEGTPVLTTSEPAAATDAAPAALEPASAPAPETLAPSAVAADGEPLDDDAWARFGADDLDDVDSGPPTQPVLRLDELERERERERRAPVPDAEDAYLTELRKAMLDDTGAPEVNEIAGEAGHRARFGRRR